MLVEAKKYANLLRFSADIIDHGKSNGIQNSSDYKDHLLRSGLAVSANITPDIHKSIVNVCNNLRIPIDCVSAFIFADPNYQAACLTTGPDECILQFSSALVNSLDTDELSFVIGHEIGHFLLEHQGILKNDLAPESFLSNRAQEISADRIGVIGAKNLNASISALIKTVSGLDKSLIRFDIAEFLSQIDELENPNAGEHINNTHPSILIRARSLIWLKTEIDIENYQEGIQGEAINKVNKRVQADLDKYVDSALNNKIKSAKAEIVMWLSAQRMIDDGKIDLSEEDKFKELFGEKDLVKLNDYLNLNGLDATSELIQRNLEDSRRILENLIPNQFSNEYSKLSAKVENLFI